MAAVGLSTIGFLGVYVVRAIVPIDYNGNHLAYVLYFSDGNNGTKSRDSFAL